MSENLYKAMKTLKGPHTDTMGISALFFGLTVALGLLGMNSALALNVSWDVLKQKAEPSETRTGIRVRNEASSVKCKLQGAAHLPAFSMDGDYIIGGAFSIHNYMHTVKHNYTTMPEPLRCTGRLVKG